MAVGQDKPRIKQMIKWWESAKQNSDVRNSLNEDLARVLLPWRKGFTSETNSADLMSDEIFDGTPMQAARGLANNTGFFLRPLNQDWIRIRVDDDAINEADEAREWIADARLRLINAIRNPRARFMQATGEVDLDLVVFGQGLIFIGENRAKDNLLFQSLHLKDATPLYNDEGIPETMFHFMKWKVRNLELRFGKENLSDATQKLIEDEKFEDQVKILHIVAKRKDSEIKTDSDIVFGKNMPWMDLWIEIDKEHNIFESGFMEFPFAAPRWDTTSGEDGGRSPGMVALPDSNSLQAMEETMLVAGQRMADPPLMVPNDGSFSALNTFPGGISYYDVETAAQLGRNPFFPLESGANLPITREMQLDKREQVFSAFFRNILNLPIDGPQMTATEVIQRKDEFIREVGPVFGRFEADYTAPMVERAFNIMLRAGAFPPVPDILQGANVRFEFESPIVKIRQQIEATAAKLIVQETMELAQADPSVLDLVDLDAFIRFSADAAAVPKGIIRGKDDVEKMRQARAEQIRAEEESEDLLGGVEAAEKGAGALQKLAKANAENLNAQNANTETVPQGA